MKKLLVIAAYCFAIYGCKKKGVECVRHVTELSCDVAFAGFSTEEMDTVILEKYSAATGFTQLLDMDTIFIADPKIKNGVTYSDTSSYRYKGFLILRGEFNYRFFFPAINTEYKVSDITSPPEIDTFISSSDHCPPGTGGPFMVTASCKINGTPAAIYTPNANNFFIQIIR